MTDVAVPYKAMCNVLFDCKNLLEQFLRENTRYKMIKFLKYF